MSIVRSELKKKVKKESKEWTEMKKRKYFKKGIFDQSGTMSSHILQLLVFFSFLDYTIDFHAYFALKYGVPADKI